MKSNKENSRLSALFAIMCLAMSISSLQAQQAQSTSKLVVNIVVDQLRGDYLSMLYDAMGEEGFKRLLNQGLVFEGVDYDFPQVNAESSLTTLLAGCNPILHGVSGPYLFDRKQGVTRLRFEDKKYPSTHSMLSLSPLAIYATTVADELKIATDGMAEVYSFSPNAETAVIGGGHAGDGIFWIDSETGNWATSSYYQFVPDYFQQFNKTEQLSRKIERMTWEPALPIDSYKFFPYQERYLGFKHSFVSLPYGERYRAFKSSPLVNDEIVSLVKLFFEKGTLGQRRFPDFLNIVLTAANYRGKSLQENAVEIQDSYLRLDRNIADLLKLIDQKVGLANALVVFSSSGYQDSEERIPEKMNIHSGNFYPRRSAALLNFYLSALYGDGQWVDGYIENQVFLNHKLIEEHQIQLAEIQARSAEFMIDMSGVQDVFCSTTFLHGRAGVNALSIREGVYPKYMADLYLEIQPGWQIQNDESKKSNRYQRKMAVAAPLIFMGMSIQPEHTLRTINATEVAPTISYYLRIRSPNGAKNRPITR